jgi:hypothetical protein
MQPVNGKEWMVGLLDNWMRNNKARSGEQA